MQCKFNHFPRQNFAHQFNKAIKVFFGLCIYVILCQYQAFAQGKQEDVVYLKNGGILHGTILENKPGESIKIQTHDRNIWVFTTAEVERTTKQEMPAGKENLSKAKGYYNATNAGLMFGGLGLNASMVNGYKWSPYFSTGGLVSYDLHPDEYLFVPVGIDLRGEILRRSITPYWLMQVAYPVISPEDDAWQEFTPGVMYQTGGGIMFMVGKKLALLTEVGYKIQHVKEVRNFGQNRTEINRQMRNISFNVGLQF